MCIDIIIERKSNGKRNSWFDAKLSIEYGVAKPFDDADLLQKITSFTYPEVGAF
jgi:hypothetical protein